MIDNIPYLIINFIRMGIERTYVYFIELIIVISQKWEIIVC